MNLAVSYSSLNYAAIAEQIARPSVAAVLSLGPAYSNYTTAKAAGDYYTMGTSFSVIWKYFFDGTLNNWKGLGHQEYYSILAIHISFIKIYKQHKYNVK